MYLEQVQNKQPWEYRGTRKTRTRKGIRRRTRTLRTRIRRRSSAVFGSAGLGDGGWGMGALAPFLLIKSKAGKQSDQSDQRGAPDRRQSRVRESVTRRQTNANLWHFFVPKRAPNGALLRLCGNGTRSPRFMRLIKLLFMGLEESNCETVAPDSWKPGSSVMGVHSGGVQLQSPHLIIAYYHSYYHPVSPPLPQTCRNAAERNRSLSLVCLQ